MSLTCSCSSCPAHGESLTASVSCPFYPSSSLTDTEWALLAPLLPPPGNHRGRGGRPEKWPRRLIPDAIFYLVRGGIAWAQLPHDFPPAKAVYDIYRRWTKPVHGNASTTRSGTGLDRGHRARRGCAERRVGGGLPFRRHHRRPTGQDRVSIVDEHTRECLGGLVERNITSNDLIVELDRLAVDRAIQPCCAATVVISDWKADYNHRRRHSALGDQAQRSPLQPGTHP